MPHELKRILVKALALRAFKVALVVHLLFTGTWLFCTLLGQQACRANTFEVTVVFVAALMPAGAIFYYIYEQGLALHGLKGD